jgi:DNA-binding transcriptional LysR family regulator
MATDNFHDLAAFVTVAEERSFTRAAEKLGVSQSALSQTIRTLESRVGIRLLTRTTRSVAPTEAGERLLLTVAPRFAEISAEMTALSELREKPAGTVRITATENAAEAVLWPALQKLLPDYPDIKVEIIIDYGLTDVVAERVDAGVRFGEQVAKDMIAVRIGPDLRMAVVGSPAYFAKRAPPKTRQSKASASNRGAGTTSRATVKTSVQKYELLHPCGIALVLRVRQPLRPHTMLPDQYLTSPFGANEDLIDDVSRIYDLDPSPPLPAKLREQPRAVYVDGV